MSENKNELARKLGLGAVIVLRCYHLHICHGFQRFIQGYDAGRLVAIVVGNKNFHGRCD